MRKRSVALAFLIVGAIVFSVCFSHLIKEKKPLAFSDYKGVLSLWQIDSFEGGTGSRKQFLMKVARKFERENKGVYVLVLSHTESSARECMDNGEYPDMISFGQGVTVKNARELLCKEYFNGGDIDGKTYAIPWCKGGYALISKEEIDKDKNIKKLVVSEREFTQPYLALAEENVYADKVVGDTPLNAYVNYLSDKDATLLGTQRDVIRLISRGENFCALPIENYNDLYQYISVCSASEEKAFYSQKFIRYLLGEKVQKSLYEIGMFSAFYQVDYDNEEMRKIEKTKHKETLFAFTEKAVLTEIKTLTRECVAKKDYDDLIKIKNMLL